MRSRAVAAMQEFQSCPGSFFGPTFSTFASQSTTDSGARNSCVREWRGFPLRKLCELPRQLRSVVQHGAPLAPHVEPLMRSRAVAAIQAYQSCLKSFLGLTVAAQSTTDSGASDWCVSETGRLPLHELCGSSASCSHSFDWLCSTELLTWSR